MCRKGKSNGKAQLGRMRLPLRQQANFDKRAWPGLGVSVAHQVTYQARYDAQEIRQSEVPLMARIYQVPRSYGARARAKARTRRGCRCPSGASMISTGGRGRGFVCQSKVARIVKKRGRRWVIPKPFVRAHCS